MSFVHLHTHTHYSFQQALWDPKGLAQTAKNNNQTAVAITDRGNLYGAFEFYQACKEIGIKPIIWVEFTISKKWRTNRDKDNEFYEIVLLAKNSNWYKNLIQLVTISQIEGFYNGKPRIDFEILHEYSSDIIALSGSMYGEIGQAIITGKSEEYITERIEYYRNIFGKENFFLEIEEHPDKPMQPKINDTIISIANKCNYEYVGTNNTFYLEKEDAEVQDMVSAVAAGKEIDDPDRATLMNGDYSLRPSREMEELFIYAPKAYQNTQKIADMIDIVIEYGDYKIPVFPLSPQEQEEYTAYKQDVENLNGIWEEEFLTLSTEEWLLRKMCIEWLNFRYNFGINSDIQKIFIHKIRTPKIEKKLSDISVEELQEIAKESYSQKKKEIIQNFSEEKLSILSRLEYELTVVNIMWFNGYFCIVADFIQYGKKNGIPVWPGRWSAAGAILAYLSGITDIDPLRYWLLFERFLNPSRVSMPDIDVDFSDEGRDEVLRYVREKYGKDRVAQVCTFGTLAARAAVKDAWKALWIPFADMNAFAKLIPSRPGITLKQALEESPEFRKYFEDTSSVYKKVIDSAMRLEGTVRQLGVHACAVIIAPEAMTNFCPLQPPPKDPTTTVTQFSAHPLEDLGLLKMDFLWLRNLAILDRAVKIVKDIHGVSVDLLKIDYEDPKVLALFWEWDMTWVFQFESPGMRKYLKSLKPSSFEDLIAMVSLYRPGPLQYIPEFIDRKFWRKIVNYPHESLETILQPTYWIAVYQEQIMQLVQAFAGFSLGEADILRRAIGKKKYDLLMEQREKFIIAAEKQWHPKDLAVYIFDEIIEPFAGYGFNKSHAACYSMIAYQTAYMKAYYPTESIVALMVSDEEDIDRIRMEISEARSKGIKILPPDINESRKHFTYIDAKTIRFGLKAIKGLGDWPIDTIRATLKDWKFTSIEDFIERTGGDVINKKSLEALIYSGALDRFWERNSLLKSIPKMIAYLKEIQKKNDTSQIGLFDMDTATKISFELEKSDPMSFEEKMKGEKEIIWYPVSGHALDWYEEFVMKKAKNISKMQEWYDYIQNGAPWEESSEEQEKEEESLSDENTHINTEETFDAGEKTFDPENVTIIGFVNEVREIPTKWWGKILFAKVESVGFECTISIFPRDYTLYRDVIQEDSIIVMSWKAKLNLERGEIAINPNTPFRRKWEEWSQNAVRKMSITQFHKYAQDMGFTTSKTISHSQEFIIVVPPYWNRDTLVELREFLLSEEPGNIEIILQIQDAQKSTKISLESIENLKKWIESRKI